MPCKSPWEFFGVVGWNCGNIIEHGLLHTHYEESYILEIQIEN